MNNNEEKPWFVKKPCKHCPYRNDVTPFLTAERGAELAYLTQNPYNSFTCHKTLEEDDESGEGIVGETSLECAGFLTLLAQNEGEWPDGSEPSWEICYTDVYEMIDAYYEQEKKEKEKLKSC